MKFQKPQRKIEDPVISKWLIDLEAIHERIQLKKDKRKAELAVLINEDKSVQIHEARQMLVIDDFTGINQRFQRILQLDPSFIYEVLDDQLDPFVRKNHINIERAFPEKKDGHCDCGCGQKLEGRKRRWATDECSRFIFQIHSILTGRSEFIRYILNAVYDYRCGKCGRSEDDFPRKEAKNGLWCSPIHLEHTLAVQHGGGGCWLSNYTFMCVDCHKIKTRSEVNK